MGLFYFFLILNLLIIIIIINLSINFPITIPSWIGLQGSLYPIPGTSVLLLSLLIRLFITIAIIIISAVLARQQHPASPSSVLHVLPHVTAGAKAD